jgi:mannan endo-1,6-alpha-mannosidase
MAVRLWLNTPANPSKTATRISEVQNCNKDQRSFKAYLSRWLAVTVQTAPFSAGQIMPWIQGSAQGAAKACIQAADGVQCGRKWNIGNDDGERDIGNQMTAMSIVQANLVLKSPPLADLGNGNSASDPSAGGDSKKGPIDRVATRKMTTGDKAGAWILTVLALLGSLVGLFALVFDTDDFREYTGFLGGDRY